MEAKHRHKEVKEVVKEQSKSLVLKTSERKIPGLRLFEYNTISKELGLATFIQVDNILDFTKPNPARDFLSKMKIKLNPDCIYIQAINEKNALKKAKRLQNQIPTISLRQFNSSRT